MADRLLAGAARKAYGEALHSGRAVGYAPDVALDDQLAAVLRAQYGKELEDAMQRLPGGGLDGLIAAVPPLTLFDVYHRQNVQGRVALQGRQPGYVRQQAKLALGVMYAQHWARRAP